MIYCRSSNSLKTKDGKLIKAFDCPLRKQWAELSLTKNPLKKYCAACQKDVVDITGFDEKEIIALFKVNPEQCAHLDFLKTSIQFSFEGEPFNDNSPCASIQNNGLPVIKTARDLASINNAIKNGFIADIKATEPLEAPKQKCFLTQLDDGTYTLGGDLRQYCGDGQITQQSSGYFKSPFSAYLIPHQLAAGTKVYIPDVIENIVSSSWNQGDEYRLISAQGMWDGNEIIIYKPDEVIQITG